MRRNRCGCGSRLAARADWATPAEIKADFRTASIVANNRVVFNIAGNKYRLIVKVNYPYRVFYIRFVGDASTNTIESTRRQCDHGHQTN